MRVAGSVTFVNRYARRVPSAEEPDAVVLIAE